MSERSRTAALLARLSSEVAGAALGGDVQVVVDRATELVRSSEHGSLTQPWRRDVLRTVAATSAVASRADAVQYELGSGPCVDTATLGQVSLLDDTDDDSRWNASSTRIAELGLRAVLSVPFGAPGSHQASLNLFSSRPRAFTADDVDLATAYAAIAGHVLLAHQQIHDLNDALGSRHTIGLAQGILVARYDLTVDQAFALLQRYSSHTNVKLRDVAAHVVEHMQLPETVGRTS